MQVRLVERAPRLLYPALAVSALIVVLGIILSGDSGEGEPPTATSVPTATSTLTPTRTSTPVVSATGTPPLDASPAPPQATAAPVADEGTTLASIKPWAAVVLTLALTALSGVVILLSRYSADDKKAAWTVVSAVLGFWVGVGAG